MKQVTANNTVLFYLFEHILHFILVLCVNSHNTSVDKVISNSLEVSEKIRFA